MRSLVATWKAHFPFFFFLFLFSCFAVFLCEVFSFLYRIPESLVSLPKHLSFPDQQTYHENTHPPSPQERSCSACAYQTTHQKQTHATRRPPFFQGKGGNHFSHPKATAKFTKTPFCFLLNSPSETLCALRISCSVFAHPLRGSKWQVALKLLA